MITIINIVIVYVTDFVPINELMRGLKSLLNHKVIVDTGLTISC